MWANVSEFEESAFDGFEQQWFCIIIVSLNLVKYAQFVYGPEAGTVALAQLTLSAFQSLAQQRFSFLIVLLRPALRQMQLASLVSLLPPTCHKGLHLL